MIYLDHHATTPVDPEVVAAMMPWFTERFGNAASQTHRYGWDAEAAVELARETLADALGAREPREVVFTSGATESDNLALAGAIGITKLAVSAIEHPAVLEVARVLEQRGVALHVLPVDGEGRVDLGALDAALADGVELVSVMAANSEVGVVAPLAEIGRRCAEHGALFHCDAAQAFGKLPIDVDEMGIDLLSASAHKLHGPKGVGLLYVRRRRRDGRGRLRLTPLQVGGGQEWGLRAGTLPVPLIAGFGKAIELAGARRADDAARLAALRDRFWKALAAVPGVHWNGPPPGPERLPGNLNVAFDGVEASSLIPELPGLALSTGSACSSARPEPSHVLAAMGLADARIAGSLRIGLGRDNDEAEVDTAAAEIADACARLRGDRAAAPRR